MVQMIGCVHGMLRYDLPRVRSGNSLELWTWPDLESRIIKLPEGEGRGRRLQGLDGLGRDAAEDFWEGVPGGEGVRESASKMPAPSRAYVIAY